MSNIMLSLGGLSFSMSRLAYDTLVLSQEYRWSAQARINRDTALQFVGRDTADIDIDGVMFPSFNHGKLSDIESLRALADKGKPHILIDGLGRNWGKWAISAISDTRTLLADNGQGRKINFKLKLKSYGDDGTAVQTFGYGSAVLTSLVTTLNDGGTTSIGVDSIASLEEMLTNLWE